LIIIAPYWSIVEFWNTQKDIHSRAVSWMFRLGAPCISVAHAMEHMNVVHFMRHDIGGLNTEEKFGERYKCLKNTFISKYSTFVQSFIEIPMITQKAFKDAEEMLISGKCPKTAKSSHWPLIITNLMKNGFLCIPRSRTSSASDFIIPFTESGRTIFLCFAVKFGLQKISIMDLSEEIEKAPTVKRNGKQFTLDPQYSVTLLLLALNLNSDVESLIPNDFNHVVLRDKMLTGYTLSDNIEIVLLRDIAVIFHKLNVTQLKERAEHTSVIDDYEMVDQDLSKELGSLSLDTKYKTETSLSPGMWFYVVPVLILHM